MLIDRTGIATGCLIVTQRDLQCRYRRRQHHPRSSVRRRRRTSKDVEAKVKPSTMMRLDAMSIRRELLAVVERHNAASEAVIRIGDHRG